MSDEPDWEDVSSPREGDYTERLKIPGGWLYRTYFADSSEHEPWHVVALALVFVPDP